MCGIGGIFNIDGERAEVSLLKKMMEAVSHRGPNDEGYALINTKSGKIVNCYGKDTPHKEKLEALPKQTDSNLALGSRRLAVLDLSAQGHQPMTAAEENICLTFNGEIYNYKELREELGLLGYQFNSNTDTEVILKSYLEWGYDCQSRFRGMWAFALWDNRNKSLFCSRDRFGIKPFFYHYDGKSFLFASEIKQLLLDSNINRDVNEKMLYRMMKIGSFLYYDDESLFSEIKVLPHSHYLVVDNSGVHCQRYYDLQPQLFEESKLSFIEAQQEYRDRLSEVVGLHLRSDIQVGSCLSGGLDSSALVCIANDLTKQPINSFTAYYKEGKGFDERKWVNRLVDRCNLKPHYISPRPEDFINDFEKMTYMHDYPVLGSSPFTQYYVMKLAGDNNTRVVLDGQGNDEINIGYEHSFYRYYADLLKKRKIVPFVSEFMAYLTSKSKKSLIEKIAKTGIAAILPVSEQYRQEMKHYLPNVMCKRFNERELINKIIDIPSSKLSNFLYHLIMTIYLQSLLHFEDRNSMAFSVESRVPYLDHKLVEFMFSLPANYKISGAETKKLHRAAMQGIVPNEIINRNDKVNFAAPGESIWLKAELNNYLNTVLQSNSFKNRGVFDTKKINRIYKQYITGKHSYGTLLWKVMAVEIWFRSVIDSR